MANIKSQMKRNRQAEQHRKANRSVRSYVKTTVTRSRQAIDSQDVEAAKSAVDSAIRALDKAVSKGVVHPNNAAKKKSRLMRLLNQLSQS